MNAPANPPSPKSTAESIAVRRATSPYVGPRSFRAGEKLYGREHESSTLLDLLIAERIILLYSPSGAGKSSLINAALLPDLEQQDFHVLPVIRVNKEPPKEVSGAAGLNRFILSALLSLEEDYPAEQRYPLNTLLTLDLDGYLSQRCEEAQKAGKDIASLVLIFDQFEEILTIDSTNRDAKMAFFNQLGLALRDRSRWALFAMREDYIAALDPFLRPVPTRLSSRFRLDLLELNGAIEAIREPVSTVGVTFDIDAAQKLVEDLSRVRVQQPDGTLLDMPGPYVEPVQLQVVCSQLWQKLPPGDMEIKLEDVDALGNINQALGSYYESLVSEAVAQVGVDERALRKWFDTKLITVQGTRAQVQLGPQDTEGLDNRAVTLFEQAYLIRSEKSRNATWFELAHDRLIQPIRDSNARWFASNLVPLQRQAEVWDQHGRPDGMLLTGRSLDEAEAWANIHSGEMNEAEHSFLEAALKAREEARRVIRYNRRIRRLGIAAGVFAVLALVVAIIAFGFYAESRRQAAIASARELSFAAIDNLTVDPDRSTLLALAAVGQAGDPRSAIPAALDALHRSFQANRTAFILTANSGPVNAVAYSPDGLMVATGSQDGNIRAWYARTGREDRTFPNSDPTAVSGLAFLPGVPYGAAGSLLAAASVDGTLSVFDTVSGSLVFQLHDGSNQALAVAFSPDGKWLASAHSDQSVRIWSLETRQMINKLRTKSSVSSVSFSSNSELIAAASLDTASVWDLKTGRKLKDVDNPTGAFNNVSFSPDSQRIVTSSQDLTVQVWNVSDGSLALRLAGHLDGVNRAVYTSDGENLVTASADRTVRVWNAHTGREEFRLYGHVKSVTDVAVSPDGTHLISASADGTARIWDITLTGNPELFAQDTNIGVRVLAFSPNGKYFAAGFEYGALQLRDAQSGAIVQDLIGHQDRVLALAYSPDGRYLASGSADGLLILWDTETDQPVYKIEPGQSVLAMAFTKNFQNLLVGGDSGDLMVLDSMTGAQKEILPAPELAGRNPVIYSLDVHPDGKFAVTGGVNGVLVLWDLEAGKPVYVLPGVHIGVIRRVRFSPDGKQLLTVGDDGLVKLLDVDLEHQTIQPRKQIEDHAGAVSALAVGPDILHPGQSLAVTAGLDLTTRLWSLPSGGAEYVLTGHYNRIMAAALSPDGKILVTGGFDSTLRGYLLDPAELVLLARSRVHRSLTLEECQLYLHLNKCP